MTVAGNTVSSIQLQVQDNALCRGPVMARSKAIVVGDVGEALLSLSQGNVVYLQLLSDTLPKLEAALRSEGVRV
jgi:hypothetical protein